MKRLAVYSLLFVSLYIGISSHFFSGSVVLAQLNNSRDIGDGTCNDGKDNHNDGKADYYGVDTNDDGLLDLEPDPSCLTKTDTEKSDKNAGPIISCYNYCTFTDVLKTINNLNTWLITKLFIPVVVLVFMYAGVRYLLAQGDPKKIVSIKKILINIFIGLLLVLCSWLVVKVILTVLVKDTDSALQFLE